jgi:hypothetical protein
LTDYVHRKLKRNENSGLDGCSVLPKSNLEICKLRMAPIRPGNANFQVTDTAKPPFHIIAKTHPVHSATISHSLTQKSSTLPWNSALRWQDRLDAVLWVERYSLLILEQKSSTSLKYGSSMPPQNQCRSAENSEEYSFWLQPNAARGSKMTISNRKERRTQFSRNNRRSRTIEVYCKYSWHESCL